MFFANFWGLKEPFFDANCHIKRLGILDALGFVMSYFIVSLLFRRIVVSKILQLQFLQFIFEGCHFLTSSSYIIYIYLIINYL